MKSNEPARKFFNKHGKGRGQYFWDTIHKDVGKAVNGLVVIDILNFRMVMVGINVYLEVSKCL